MELTNTRHHTLEREQFVPISPEEAFVFFSDAHNLEQITPPFLRFRVLTPRPIAMGEGTLIDYRLHLHGLPIRWKTRIETWEPGVRFVDRQLRGPYALWHHTHTFEAAPGGTLLRDVVRYRLHFGPLGRVLERLFVRRDVERIFDYRRAVIARVLGGTL